MIILEHVYNKDDILEINTFQNGFVKGVVDIEEELVALDADMHYQLADYLKEKCESKKIFGDLIFGWKMIILKIFLNMIL